MAKGTASPWVGSLVLPLGVWVSWEKSLALSASSIGKQDLDGKDAGKVTRHAAHC